MADITNLASQSYFVIDTKNLIVGVLSTIITNVTTNGIPIVKEIGLITRATDFIQFASLAKLH